MAAVVSAAMSLLCCVPLGLPAALGLAGMGMIFDSLRPWFMGFALVLLVLAVVQFIRRPACERRRPVTLLLLACAAAVVPAVVLLPQTVATMLADLGPSTSEGSSLQELNPASLEGLKSEFNKAAGGVRIIVLLSPT